MCLLSRCFWIILYFGNVYAPVVVPTVQLSGTTVTFNLLGPTQTVVNNSSLIRNVNIIY
jgi:hypothetical protein